MKYLIPTLLVLPLLEIFVLIEVGSYIGALSTIGLVLLTAVLGLVLLRHEGLTAINKARNKLLNEEMPAEEIFTGFFLAIGGLLLITPGFVTDLVGFFCLSLCQFSSAQPNNGTVRKKAPTKPRANEIKTKLPHQEDPTA